MRGGDCGGGGEGGRIEEELACLFIWLTCYKGMRLLKARDRKIDGERQTGKQGDRRVAINVQLATSFPSEKLTGYSWLG